MEIKIYKGFDGPEFSISITRKDLETRPWDTIKSILLIKAGDKYYWKTRDHNENDVILEYSGSLDSSGWFILSSIVIENNEIKKTIMPMQFEEVEKITKEIESSKGWKELIDSVREFISQIYKINNICYGAFTTPIFFVW